MWHLVMENRYKLQLLFCCLMLRIDTPEAFEAATLRAAHDREGFWAEIARSFVWARPFERVLDWEFSTPKVEWFGDGLLNITTNCIDRHLPNRASQKALIWEPNNPEETGRSLTYQELHDAVCLFANTLKKLGVGRGDRVCIYMPMVPELMLAVLACARIGAVHSVVFAGFSAIALADRIADAGATMVITTDGMARGPKNINIKTLVDEAVILAANNPETPTAIEHILVVQHLGTVVDMEPGRDVWYHEASAGLPLTCPAEPMAAEDLLFILYTSGSTGKPKGVVHTCGGYMVFAGYTFANVFQPQAGDVFWCTADMGWVTGHTYLTYGPLLNGCTTLMFEGVPTHPTPSRFWEVIERHKVNIFYTAPTAIRSVMAFGEDLPMAHPMPSLRTLGSVGEPINEEAWHWYHRAVGKGRCPIVDTWWQTETGGVLISGLAGVLASAPTEAGLPLPGISPVLLAQDGSILLGEAEGYLAIDRPWPGMLRSTYGDHARCYSTYFAPYPGYYFTGDGARRNAAGEYRIIGRVDDVINVSGHRFGTAEIENAINMHGQVIESAVVGYPHAVKGQGIFAFVIADGPHTPAEIVAGIARTVAAQIGPIAKPDRVLMVDSLPKTRSGKIMRRILRKIAEGEYEALGDTSTLLDPDLVARIVAAAKGL